MKILAASGLLAAGLIFPTCLLQAKTNEISGNTNGFSYRQSGKSVSITGYDERSSTALLPAKVNGLPVTSVGDGAFSRLRKISTVLIPQGITNIGNDAFSYCSRLSYLTLPDSLEEIGTNAFYECRNLVGIAASDDILRWVGSNAADLGILFDREPVTNRLFKSQIITFPSPPKIAYGDQPITLNATSPSKLPVYYSSSDTNVADFTKPNPNWRPGKTNIPTVFSIFYSQGNYFGESWGSINYTNTILSNSTYPTEDMILLSRSLRKFTTLYFDRPPLISFDLYPSESFVPSKETYQSLLKLGKSLPFRLQFPMETVFPLTNTNAGQIFYSNSIINLGSPDRVDFIRFTPFRKLDSNTWAIPIITGGRKLSQTLSNQLVAFTNSNTGTPSYSIVIVTNSFITDNTTFISAASNLLIKGAGTTTITAYQFGDGLSYNPATPVTRKLIVSKQSQSITFPAPTNDIRYSTAAVPINGYSSSGLPVSFYIDDPRCTIAVLATNSFKTKLIPLGVGTVTVTAFQDGNGNVSPAKPVKRQIRIVP